MKSIHFESVKLTNTAYLPNQLLNDQIPQIAFIGRSNVGKSSLINNLLRRKNLAKTSGKPGKTLSINYYLVEESFYFVDLPGFGYAKTSKSEIERANKLLNVYFKASPTLRVVCLLIDSRRGFGPKDLEIIEKICDLPIQILTIATKADKLKFSERKRLIHKHQKEFEISLFPFSIKEEPQRDKLLNKLLKIAEVEHVLTKRS